MSGKMKIRAAGKNESIELPAGRLTGPATGRTVFRFKAAGAFCPVFHLPIG
jgi:hypothetical protein